ncbi:MAG: 4Fe-4S dicluster domain-containing protein [Thermoleophilia bacterium]
MTDLISTIQKVLADTDLVLGWTRSQTTGVVTPARFHNAAEAEAAIFDATCVHNLAVHLPGLKTSRVGIVAKACDARSVVQLIVERELERDRVRVIGVACAGVLDVKLIWRRHGWGAAITDEDGKLTINGESVDRETFTARKCRTCADSRPVIYDELVGAVGAVSRGEEAATRSEQAVAPRSETISASPDPLAERFAAMSAVERRKFWDGQFSRCIRCYACREACPMCFCRDVCTMQSRDPHWAGGQIDREQSAMVQHVRVTHLAGRCTGCGQCERACPVGIPLMLLMDEQNRIVEEMFDYQAGTDLEAVPPLLTFDLKADSWGEGR